MASRLSSFLRSPWGIALKVAVSVGLLGIFFYGIDYGKLRLLVARVTGWHLAALAALTLVRNVAGAVRNRIVVAVRKPVPFPELLRQQFLASFFNNFLPTAIGGDGARVYYLAQYDIPAADAALLILVERLVGFYALILFSAVSALFWEVPEVLRWPIFLAAAGYTGGLLWLFYARPTTLSRLRHLKRVSEVFALFHRQGGLLTATLFWSIAYQAISIYISYYVAVLTLGDVSILPFLTLVPLVWFFTMVPITLGGVGLRELAFIELLALIGVAQEKALFISLGTYLALVISGAVGGLIYLAHRPRRTGSRHDG
jgi:uncharacterized membrane protein YbhN (UPF0104 family)